MLSNYMDGNIVIGGDFNVCLNPALDKKGGKNDTILKYSKSISQFSEVFNVVDIWRVLYPNSLKYTWRGITRNGLVMSRLDFWLTSAHMIYDLDETTINPGIKSDHSIISLSFKIRESQKRGRGFWKFNYSLLKDTDYIALVKERIAELSENYTTFANKALVWDVIKCELRSITVSYSSYKAKQNRAMGDNLMSELRQLENQLNEGKNVLNEYNRKKEEVEDFNDMVAEGIFIRSRAQWTEDSEKCTKYFLQLEKRNYNNKYIKTLHTDAAVLTNPSDILEEQERFYKDLYTDKLKKPCKEACSLFNTNKPQLTPEEKNTCDDIITIEELGSSLKDLPNNKTPGSDGFTTDFYKFFWKDIKNLVFNSYLYSFESGELSIDQRRAILTLLPKPNKDIRFSKTGDRSPY